VLALAVVVPVAGVLAATTVAWVLGPDEDEEE